MAESKKEWYVLRAISGKEAKVKDRFWRPVLYQLSYSRRLGASLAEGPFYVLEL